LSEISANALYAPSFQASKLKNTTKEINFMRLLEKKIVNYLPYYKKFVLLHADYYQGAVKRFTLRVNSLPDGQG
jgi:hypothetical protein